MANRPTLHVALQIALATLLFHIAPSHCDGQVIPKYDLAGAKKPKPDLNFRKTNQYKRVHQSTLRFILRGELNQTERFLNEFLQQNPDDEETLFILGILQGQKNDLQLAEDYFNKAIKAGLPEGRLIAGPRKLLEPMAESKLLEGLRQRFEREVVHGPMLGNVTGNSASIWIRTANETEVEILARSAVEPTSSNLEIVRSKKVNSKSEEDFTAVVTLNNLQPNTEYNYTVFQNGIECKPTFRQKFRTLAPKGTPSKFTIAFGGGAGYIPENERMWNTIGSFDPHAILLLGDNVYIDDPESVAMQQYTYQRRQSRPEWRKLTSRSPVFSIWDDHDFGTDDCWGGPTISKPFWKKDWVYPIFRQNWANPGYGGGNNQPGCWYAFHVGDVDFIMLDCRYYRTNPKSDRPSMLGEVQKKWLKKQLASANGTFKVICSSVPWDFRTKGDSLDTWNGFKAEHEEILSFIESNKIEGVLLMSADRHRSDAWKIKRPNSYDLFEFNSSRLTNQHVHPTMEEKGAIFSFNKPQSFGLVTFDTTLAEPLVTYEVVDIDGKKRHSLSVKRSELQRK